jgi:hypothetical protein
MPEPTLSDLAARVARIETQLGIVPPTPYPMPPAAPTGLRLTTLADGRLQLDWDPATDADSWDVLDLLNTTNPVKDTVTVPRAVRSALKPGTSRRYAVQARNAGGRSGLSGVLEVPAKPTPGPEPVPTPAPGNAPGSVLDLRYWYLTLPTGKAGSPDTVHMPDLNTYSSKYFELTPEGDAVVFRVWHGGATTIGSANPRSELREENVDGSHAAWSTTAGKHSMTVEGHVNRLTKVRPYVVIGQIHSATDDVTVFRVEGDKLWITAGNTPHGYLLDDQFTLGKPYSIGFDVADGVISYRYNGATVPYTLKAATTGNYFKTGAYLQSNPTTAPTESTTEYAEVVIRSVTVTHN